MATGIDLGKQVGPLPLGAWIAVVGAGLGFAYYTSKTTARAPVVVEDTSMDPGVGEGPGWVAVPPPSYGPPGAPEPTTNEEWGRNAINHLIAQGYNSAAADSAVRKYLATEQLSITEYALITEALRKLGAPPVPLPPGNNTPATPDATEKDTVRVTISGPTKVRFHRLYTITVRLTRLTNPTRGDVAGRVDIYRNGKIWKSPWVNGSRQITTTAWVANGRQLSYSAKYQGSGNALPATSNTINIQAMR
jgi:hypothetical protein